MAPDRITRRRALGAGAATIAAGALAPSSALARRPALFELDLSDLDGGGAVAAGAGWRTTPVLRAPRTFDLIGLRWTRGTGVEAQVRARRGRGPWSPWLALHAAGDHAPDGDRRRPSGTEPAWTDSADVFQLRLRGRPRGLRARFVRAKPTAALAAGITGRLRRRATASRRSQTQPPPAGSTPPPRIITRTEWGADSVPPKNPPSYGEVHLAFVHHTVTANDYNPEDSPAIVLGIARYHRDSNGWNDIGYNFLVDKYGQVFEGRAGGMELAVVGAQAQGYNSVSTGIAVLGDYRAIPDPQPGIDALAQLIAWKLAMHGAPAQGQVTVTSQGGPSNRYPAGTPVVFERIAGHRDGDETTCPGDGLYLQLQGLREQVMRRTGSASALTVRVATRRVRFPTTVATSGELRFADGSPASGAPVELQYQPPGGAWQPIGSTACGPDGRWTAEVSVPTSGLVRAAFNGDAGRPPLQAAPVSVTVLPRLTLALSARRLRNGRAVRVTGTLSPPPPDGRVECRLERQAGSRWVTAQRKRINVRNGGFDTKVRPRRAGLYRVTITTPGATKRLRVRITRS